MKIFIPITPAGGSTPQSRQKFIEKSKQYIPCIFPNRVEHGTRRWRLDVKFHYLGSQIKDIDNSLKSLLDSIKNRMITDDADVRTVFAQIVTHSDKSGIEVEATEI